jgi:recombinational DNA repair protein (RecF pathway)
MTNDELTYCEECLRNLEDDKFDYRFDRPVCLECVENKNINPEEECGTHTWVLQMNIANTPTQNYCEECGATEPADPDDVAEQLRLLGEND